MSTLFEEFGRKLKRKFNPDKYLEPAARKPGASSDPAPEELFSLVSDAIDAAVNKILADIAQHGGDFGDGWRYNLEELICGGAFDKQQMAVLEGKLKQLSQHVARTKAHVVATKIICGVEPQGDKVTVVTSGGIYATQSKSLSLWK